MKRILLSALGIAGLGLVLLGTAVLGQDGTVVVDPTLADLTTVTGLAAILTVFMNLLRGVTPADVFDKFAPLAAALLGIVISLGVTLTTGGPDTGESLIVAGLVGFLAGNLSQNVNTILTRAVS